MTLLARSKLNSIEHVRSKINPEDFISVTQEKEKYCKLKKNVRIVKSQRSDVQKNKLIADVRMGFHIMIKQNEKVTNNLKLKSLSAYM